MRSGGPVNLLPFDRKDVGNNRVSAICEACNSRRMSNLGPLGNTRGRPDCGAERQTSEFELEIWRRRPDLNRGSRFCRPLPYHLATAPIGIEGSGVASLLACQR